MSRHVDDARHALAQARVRGAVVHQIGPVTSTAEALEAIGAAFGFPPWYGRNLDALYDCLVDLSWQPTGEHLLIWTGHQELAAADPDGYRAVLAVLDDAAAANSERPLSVLLADR